MSGFRTQAMKGRSRPSDGVTFFNLCSKRFCTSEELCPPQYLRGQKANEAKVLGSVTGTLVTQARLLDLGVCGSSEKS